MYFGLKKLNNKSGIVLFIVLMTALIIMIISASILSSSMDEINFAQQQIDQITSDQLAKGIFWNEYSAGMPALATNSMILNGRQYTYSLTNPSSGVYNVSVSYDTFQ